MKSCRCQRSIRAGAKARALLSSLGAFALAATLSCSREEPAPEVVIVPQRKKVDAGSARQSEEVRINPRLLRRFQPLERASFATGRAEERARVDLGRALFYDMRLSKRGDLSCNSCHDLARYGVDGLATSEGHEKKRGRRNAPTVYNAAGFFAQFWDGRASTIEEQAVGPVLNPVEMAMPSAREVAVVLKRVPEYVVGFRRAFPSEPDPVTLANAGKAIGAFERGLLTPGRWDDYLRGDEKALSNAEKAGLKVFLDSGCVVCHTGRFLGGSMFERVGVVEPWPNQSDKGRAEVTQSNEDAMMFKVPTLRNIAKTAPYFHDGSAATLDVAVRMMGKHQLGLELTDEEVSSITTWLGSLTGEIPVDYIAKRPLPSEAVARAP